MMWRRLDAALLLDKPFGLSSNAALLAAKRLFRAAKAGHGGTLDPLATGLLPVFFGEATKFAGTLLEAEKEYQATLKLGETTVTGDAEGVVLERRPVRVSDAEIDRVLALFRGPIEQRPPMYSALKRDGAPLYRLARQGKILDRPLRKVQIYALELIQRRQDLLELRVRCSKGTYIRQLAADLGAALGTGAHLAALRRVAVGSYRLDRAVTLDDLQAMGEAGRRAWLLPAESLLQELPRLDLPEEQAERFLAGQGVEVGAPEGPCRVYRRSGPFLGIGEPGSGGRLQPRRLLARG